MRDQKILASLFVFLCCTVGEVRCVAVLSVTSGAVGQLQPNITKEQVVFKRQSSLKKGSCLEESVPSLKRRYSVNQY